jgi:hypothetical protein
MNEELLITLRGNTIIRSVGLTDIYTVSFSDLNESIFGRSDIGKIGSSLEFKTCI